MWLSAIIPLGFFIVAGAVTETCNPKACSRDADAEKAVCGSDGLSYPNRCLLEKARCKNQNLTLVKRGPCKQQRACLEWDTSVASSLYNNSFKPKCRPDGTYELAQCHPDSGACWCVTPEGLPLPYTTSRRGKPRCGRKRKSTRRRSPSRKHKSRICKRADKATLNNNLINSFHSEFNRDTGKNESDTVVITWKFRALDLNNDEVLDKTEYRDLRKVVKKAVRPKRCAKNFPRSCDVNSDQMIGLQEWAECLTRDGIDDGRSQNTSNDSGDDSEDYEENFSANRSPPHGVLSPGVIIGPNYEEESSEIREETEPTDCLSDRNVSLSEGYQLYVPECTPDGRYQKIQCYKSAGYCWCVNEDTGKNIPGTSIKNGVPKCDHLKTSNKTMKGCPDDKKLIFLKELLQFLHSRMSEIVNSTTSFSSLAWIASKEEQAATWSFVVFDKNKNKMLERNEWKTFKDMVGSIKGLRKCGKKLPRYCDSNKDRQISMTEWLECLNVQQGLSTNSSPPSSRAGKKNPLSMLKDD